MSSNAKVVGKLRELADLSALAGENKFKVGAYQRAAQTLEQLPNADLTNPTSIHGIGESIGKVIKEVLETGTCEKIEELKKSQGHLLGLLKIRGVGPTTAKRLYDIHKVTSAEEMKKLMDEGEKFTKAIREGIVDALNAVETKEEVEAPEHKAGEMLNAALEYLEVGLHPIPIQPNGKVPLMSWQEYQKRQPTKTEVTTWWTRWPNANIAIVTGTKNGVAVIDIDPGHDGTWPKEHKLPEDCVAKTPRGGRHYFVKHAKGIKNSQSGLAKDVDTRGEGGYVLVAPSTVKNKSYEFIKGNLKDVKEPESWLKEELLALSQES